MPHIDLPQDDNFDKSELLEKIVDHTCLPEDQPWDVREQQMYRAGFLASELRILANSSPHPSLSVTTTKRSSNIGIVETSFPDDVISTRKFSTARKSNNALELKWMLNGRTNIGNAFAHPDFMATFYMLAQLRPDLKLLYERCKSTYLSINDCIRSFEINFSHPQVLGGFLDAGNGTFYFDKMPMFYIQSIDKAFIESLSDFLSTKQPIIYSRDGRQTSFRLSLAGPDACNLALYVNAYMINNRNGIEEVLPHVENSFKPSQRQKDGRYTNKYDEI